VQRSYCPFFDLSVSFFDILSQPPTQFNSTVLVDFSYNMIIIHKKWKGDIDMKKMTAILLALGCMAALCGCYSTMPITEKDKPSPVVDATAEPSAQVTSPVREVNAEELCTESGLTFVMPMNAGDVHCSIIDSAPAVYQMRFVLGGKDYTVRAAHTDTLDESISGVYTDWATVGDGAMQNGDPTCFYLSKDETSGVYYAYTDGVTWCVSMTGGGRAPARIGRWLPRT